ncbi:hypothetical protein J7L05_12570 [bacterium]|nr:hypothetical protein [bacterium]
MNRNERVDAFWKKSVENKEMSDLALTEQMFNVAASRYYYALRFAFNALLEKKQVIVPDRINRNGMARPNPNPGTWPRPEMHWQANRAIQDYPVSVDRLLKRAWKLRVLGDYSPTPVEQHQIEHLKNDADGLFQLINQKVQGE